MFATITGTGMFGAVLSWAEATKVSMIGRTCGMKTSNAIAVLLTNELVKTRPNLSSTRCINLSECHRCHAFTMFQYHLHHMSCTGRGCTTWSLRSSTREEMFSLMTARKATPIGSLDGLPTRSPGAVTTWTWGALAPGMAAITSTVMSLPKGWGTHTDESTIVMLASPIGCRAGRIPRRTGAARNATGAAWSSTALQELTLDSIHES